MSKTLLYTLLLMPMVIASCGDARSVSKAGIVSEKEMAELLVDTHLSDAILFNDKTRADEKRDKALFYYPSVLEKHGITKTQMDSSVAWYMRHPAAYARIYQQVIRDLEKRQAAVKKEETTE